MSLYYSHAGIDIHLGDAVACLRELPDESVNCCVTSPPYWGLRDYGTGQWEGGDAGCDHRASGERRQLPHGDGRPVETDLYANERVLLAGVGATFKDVCGKCGAIRIDLQLGLEKTPEEYIAKMVAVFREVRRVLRSDGSCWVNMGDSYAANRGYQGPDNKHKDVGNAARMTAESRFSRNVKASTLGGGKVNQYNAERAGEIGLTPNCKPKDLVGIPWMLAFALRADGWWLRQDIIWAKPNPMPESVTDRCTKSHEYVFMLSKSANYFYDAAAIAERAVSTSIKKFTDNGIDKQRGHSRRH